MRFIPLSGLLLAGMISSNAIAQTTPKEVESTTKSVTIYLRGVKENRTASTQVTNGEQQLLFTDLPQRLNPSTIRLGSSDFVQIVSINHKLNYVSFDENESPEIKQLKDSMDHYAEQLKLKTEVVKALASTKQMILSNRSVKGENSGMEAEDVSDLLDFYRDKLNEINTKTLALEKQLEVLRGRHEKFNKEYNKQISGKAKTFSELLVTVRSKQSAKANFTIEFYTPDAGWNPLYDIRNKGAGEELEITSHAQIWQKTGYDWKNVDILLSTLDPQFNIEAPTIYPQQLDLGVVYRQSQNQQQLYEQYKQQYIMADSVVLLQKNMEQTTTNGGSQFLFNTPTNANTFGWSSGSAPEKGPGTEYKIATPYSISSNAKDKRIEIERKMVKAMFKYKTVPKVEKAVFLMAIVTGWDTLNYFPGTANVFNNGTFVGSVYLNTQSVDDSLEISLGQDKSFSVEYEIISDKTFTNNSGSSKKIGRGFMIRIMNKKQEAVMLEVMDQAPITTTQDVSIEINKGDGEINPMSGIVTWRKSLPPGQKVELPISYSVKYPKEHTLYNF